MGLDRLANNLFYEDACGASSLGTMRMLGNGVLPVLGEQGYGLSVLRAEPNAPIVFVAGASDQVFGSLLLPYQLPGGCTLGVTPLVALVLPTPASGRADQPLPIPDLAALAGARFFAQWVLPQPGTVFATSGLSNVRIGTTTPPQAVVVMVSSFHVDGKATDM